MDSIRGTSKTSRPPDDEPLQSVGRYVLLEKLSEGGMGVVHRARDSVSGRIVALKQLKSAKAGGQARSAEALFEREYYTLAGLRHPGIIEVYDYGVSASGAYYTMELLDGSDLAQLGALPYRDACRYLRDVASSLALLHAHRLVHRDVSPRNIRLTGSGRAKLIDFGALASFGFATEIVGTPHCMAPEILRGMPLDQRTDLFALGAVAYYALTGTHAYRARSIPDLEAAWLVPPAPPSSRVADIPPALERLVMALLHPDPDGRPSSAAAVMDELGAIAELLPEEYQYAAESYLQSGRFSGRETEQAWFDQRVARALSGKGAAVLLEGPMGIGRTRLLHELCLSSQLKGMNVVKTDAASISKSLGVVAALVSGLLERSPDVARHAAHETADLIGSLSVEVQLRLRSATRQPVQEIGEHSVALQKALHDWFLKVAARVPLLLAIDNLQSADSDSVAFLANLATAARDSSLVFVATLATTRGIRAPSVEQFRGRAARLRLGGLSPEAIEELVRSIFGNVTNVGRVARLLHQKSAGVPRQCTDLVRLLVAKKIATYVGGIWVLPFEVAENELPDQADEILVARISHLSRAARRLAGALSIYTKPIGLEQCLAALESAEAGEVHGALDELLAEQVLTSDGMIYRFREEPLREAILGAEDEAQRRRHHLRAAETLLRSPGENLDARIQAAAHLLRGGEHGRGADMLAQSSWEFASAASRGGHSRDFVDALRGAIQVYEREGRSERELAGLYFALVLAASHSSEYRLLLEYGARALALGYSALGLAHAARAARFTGPRASHGLGVLLAKVGFARERQRGLPYDFQLAVQRYCLIVVVLASTAAICMDKALAAQLRSATQSLVWLGPPGVLAAEYARSQHFMAKGQNDRVLAAVQRMQKMCEQPAVARALDPMQFAHTYGGVYFDYGLLEAAAFGDRALERAQKLDDTDQRLWAVTADAVRVLYYAFRGESAQVARYRDELELLAAQIGGTWQVELFIPILLIEVEMLTDDVLALRRAWEQFSRLAHEIKPLDLYAQVARAAYLSARGATSEALTLYEQLLPVMSPRWRSLRAHFCRTLIRAGQHARAKELLTETIRACSGQDEWAVGRSLEPHRQLALAESGLGNHAEANRILDGLLARHGHQDQPLLIGLLHQAKAEVALDQGELSVYHRHFDEMERRFTSTRNPALLTQVERLADRASRMARGRGLNPADAPVAPIECEPSLEARVQSALRDVTGRDGVCARVLELIREEVSAEVGYLYLLSGDELERVSANTNDEPPPALEAQLLQGALRARIEAEERDRTQSVEGSRDGGDEAAPRPGAADTVGQRTIIIDPASSVPGEAERLRIVLLETERDEETVVVGGALLDAPQHRVLQLPPEFLSALATALLEHL